MKKKKKAIDMYAEWLTNTWAIAGGLILQSDVARVLNLTEGRISQMCKEGKLRKYEIEDNKRQLRFISYSDMMKIKEERKGLKKIKV